MFGKINLLRTIHNGFHKQNFLPRRDQEVAPLPGPSLETAPVSDPSVLLNAVVRRACTLLNLASGALYLLRADEGMLETVAGYRLPASFIGKKFSLGDGLAARVIRAQKPISAADYLAGEGGSVRICGLENTPARRTAGIPIFVDEQIAGALVLIDPQMGTFTDEEIRLMTLFAGQAAAAIENARLHAQMKQLAVTDALTGLFNRLFFDAELARLELGGYFPVSIIVADLNCPKLAGDHHGHALHDELLKNVAQILQQTFRAGDIIARVGTDEFAVLLPHTGSVMAKQMLVRVQIHLAEYNAAHPDLPVQLSLGTSTAQQGELTEALIAADQRLYSHKTLHRSLYLEKVTLAIPQSATSAI